MCVDDGMWELGEGRENITTMHDLDYKTCYGKKIYLMSVVGKRWRNKKQEVYNEKGSEPTIFAVFVYFIHQSFSFGFTSTNAIG